MCSTECVVACCVRLLRCPLKGGQEALPLVLEHDDVTLVRSGDLSVRYKGRPSPIETGGGKMVGERGEDGDEFNNPWRK
jgi:hypothetical protein